MNQKDWIITKKDNILGKKEKSPVYEEFDIL